MAGSLQRLGINQLNHKLKIRRGGFEVTNGNISGSLTSTGSFGKLEVAGNTTLTGDITIGGNMTLGDADTDSINITADLTSNLIPNADSTYDIGSSSKNWRYGYVEQLSATHVTASNNITATAFSGSTMELGSNLTSKGTISGSSVYGTTIGQNRTDGLKTITIESNSTINQDVTTDATPTFGGLTLTGDLTVQGDTTTLSTTNLQVGDAFIFAATGSAASNVDGGLIVQSGSAVDSGSAIYHDTQDERWAVAKGVASDGTAVTPTAYVSTITTANHNPNTDSGSYGSGEMWVNTTDEEIWVRTG